MVEEKVILLKNVADSISEGIQCIESYLSKVESDELNYDLNRQLKDYLYLKSCCNVELQRYEELLEDTFPSNREEVQPSNESFQYRLSKSQDNNPTDQKIAQSLANHSQHCIEYARSIVEHSSSDAVSDIAMEVMKEEETHMGWMKSYVNERFHQN